MGTAIVAANILVLLWCSVAHGSHIALEKEGTRVAYVHEKQPFDSADCEEKVAKLENRTAVSDLPTSLDDIGETTTYFNIEGTQCAFGTNYIVSLLKRDTSKLLIVFGGGGICFSEATCCAPAELRTYSFETTCDTGLNEDHTGLLSPDPRNPLRNHSVLILPSCNGDVFMGDVTVEYSDSCTIQHRGSPNVNIVLDFALNLFKGQLNHLAVAGLSAGGYGGSFFFAKIVRDLQAMQPEVTTFRAMFFKDSAVGVAVFPPSLQFFVKGVFTEVFEPNDDFPNFSGFIPLPENFRIIPPLEGTLPEVVEWNRALDPDATAAFLNDSNTFAYLEFSFAADLTQQIFADLTGSAFLVPGSCENQACARAFTNLTLEAFKNSTKEAIYSAFLSRGISHIIAFDDEMYALNGTMYEGDMEQEGAFIDWFSSKVDQDIPTASPSPSTSPSPSPTTEAVCFPADATVELETGRFVHMSELEIGDRVRVDATSFSDIFMFTHQRNSIMTSMVHLEAGDAFLDLSSGHYLWVGRKLITARSVQIGDEIILANGTMRTVTGVSLVVKQGLYNPQTIHGDIVVNGIVASTYTQAVHPLFARFLLIFPKLAYTMGLPNPFVDQFLHDNSAIAAFLPHGSAQYQ